MMEDTEKEDHSNDDDDMSPDGLLETGDHQNMSQANIGSQY